MKASRKYLLLAVLLAIAVLFKFLLLDRVPGINADEAVGAVWMRDYVQGLSAWPWWTPTDRVLVPLYPAMVLFVTELFPPGFGYMRLVPAFSHMALLVAAWLTLRKTLPTRERLLFVLLLASLPLHTAFARIAWEPCLIPVMCYLAVFWAIDRKFIAASLMLFAAVLTHSTCIFLAPLLFILWAAELGLTLSTHGTGHRRAIMAFLLMLVMAAAMAKFVSSGAGEPASGSVAREMWTRVIDLKGWLQFAGLFFYTAIGKASFSEFTGAPLESRFLPSMQALGLLTMAAFPTLMYVFATRGRRHSVILLGGFAVSVMGFYLIAGTLPVSVGYQRYALWMGVPLVFILHEALTLSRHKLELAMVLCAVLLAYTAYGYFYKSLTTPGGPYPAIYATGTPEPKRAAFEWIHATLAAERSQAPTPDAVSRPPVLAESWWLFWTGRYWLYEDGLEFFHAEKPIPTGLPVDRQMLAPADMQGVLDRDGFVVAFANGPVAQQLRDSELSGRYHAVTFEDARQQPLIIVWHGAKKP